MKDDEIRDYKEAVLQLQTAYDFHNSKSLAPYNVDWESVRLILDYITNLQQENEILKKNQRYYKNGVFSLEYDKETMSDMIDDYKSRCEKALKLAESYDLGKYDYSIPAGGIVELKDILNGRSDE